MNMEAIVHDDMVCLLCLQIPKEWFVIEACGCRFCLQVSFIVYIFYFNLVKKRMESSFKIQHSLLL